MIENDDINLIIISYLNDIVYKLNYLLTNKYHNQLKLKIKNVIKHELGTRQKYINKYFPHKIRILFDDKLINYPILDWNDKFLGIDYIDRITANDIEYPIMMGRDRFKRSYITLLFYSVSDEKKKYPIIVTLFQRYTGERFTWTHGSCFSFGSIDSLIENPGHFYIRNVMREEKLKFKIESIIKNNCII